MNNPLDQTTCVLGGGGVWGAAWMTGIIMGLAEAGLDLRGVNAVVGTSAGAVVGAQLTSDVRTEEFYHRQIEEAGQAEDLTPPVEAVSNLMAIMHSSWDDPVERMRRLGALAASADATNAAARRQLISERMGLSATQWPTKSLRITAVDVDNGQLHAFGNESNVSLVDAVAASCAVPGLWPCIEIGGRRYMDGGVWRTSDNAHLAVGASSVIVISPFGKLMSSVAPMAGLCLDEDLAHLRASGARVCLISPDQPSVATMGANAFAPETRGPGAKAGRVQGRSELEHVLAVL